MAEACVGSKVDLAHSLVAEWLGSKNAPELIALEAEQRNKAKASSTKSKPKASAPADHFSHARKMVRKTSPKPQGASEGIKDLEDLTVREVVMRYGSVDGFKRFVESLKNIAEYKHREIRVRQQRNELIERDKVAGVIFPMIDVAFSRLVSDVPDTLAKLVIARVESGGPETATDVVQLIRDANSQVLKNVKHNASKLEVLSDANY